MQFIRLWNEAFLSQASCRCLKRFWSDWGTFPMAGKRCGWYSYPAATIVVNLRTQCQLPVMGSFAPAVLLCLAASALPASAQIYVGASSNGSVVLSNFASTDAPTVLIVAPAAPRTAMSSMVAGPSPAGADIAGIVLQVAAEFGVSPHLLHAIIGVESAYDPRAVSSKGAQGLMQLMPATARRFGVLDPFDPHENVRGGARYIKSLLEQFNGDLALTLAAYNAGENAVVRYGNRVPPFAETRKYVPKVMARMKRAADS
jgi:soluble lytic murein transglycosylase-like protein